MSAPLLEARQVTVSFGRGKTAFAAVRDASLHVSPGEAIGIVGESGSGKTTLARVLVGLLPPAAGEVWLEGRPLLSAATKAQLPQRERWKVQMVFQDPYSSLNPRMRGWQAVAEAVQVWQYLTGKAARERAYALLGSVGISPTQAEQFPQALSGGQRQRVSVARALAPNPKVLIADEPTSAIDQSAQAQLLNLFRRLQAERGLAIVFISHDLSLVRYLTQRVYVMQTGQVVETGATQQVFQQPQHPYTHTLIAAIPGRRLSDCADLERRSRCRKNMWSPRWRTCQRGSTSL